MPSVNCFDAATLRDYLLGMLSDEQCDVVAAHLEACLSCEATVSQLDRASDTLTNGLRSVIVADEPATDAELQQALDKVQSLEPVFEQRETSEVSKTSEVPADRSPVLRDYRLLEPLGSGGMGTVYKAVHTRLDRLVAVKLLPARRLGDEQAVARFQREMRVIGQLSHPAIVQATDAGEVDGTHFLVMEYVEGCDLNTLAKACGTLSIADACEIARQAAVGLEYAHQQGIVHRDIKPSNLMLSFVVPPLGGSMNVGHRGQPPEGGTTNIKILDLGLALLSGVQAPVDELTTVGQLMGTLDYMAPEQLEDSHQVGPAADIYALAATLYRLLTGAAPFAKDDRKTPLQKLRALATQAAPPIRERRADVPEALAAIIDRALSRDPAERFVSMSEFAAALLPWCAGCDLAALSQRTSHLDPPEFDAGRPLPAPLSPWERAGVRDPLVVQARSRESSADDQPLSERRQMSDRIPHPNFLPGGEGTGRRQPRRAFIIALLAFFGFVSLGIVIFIETNKGTLIVESLRDGVEVRVKKSGKSVEQFELTTGPKSARLTAGEYEIEIVGDADGLQIQNGKFVLKRGDTVVAKITEKPKVVVAEILDAVGQEKFPEQPAEPQPRKPVEIVDRNAKGMETFEASTPDLADEKKVRDVLQKNVTAEFVDLPLVDVLRFLQKKTEIEFFLEAATLEEAGLATDTPVTLSLKDKPTTTVLEFLLRPIQCAWYIDGGQVVITTAAKEKDVLVTRTYPVGKLLPGVRQAVERLKSEPLQGSPKPGQGGGFGGGGGGGFFQVSSTTQFVGTLPVIFGQFPPGGPPQDQPVIPTEASHFQELLSESLGHAWMDYGGEGGTCELLHNVLVVRQTRRAHADVESLLRAVEAAFLKPLTDPVEIRPAGYSLEADANVRRQLARKLEVAFTDKGLSDVAIWLSEQLEVQVLIDRVALREEGIGTDLPVSLQFQGISGDVLLSRLLKPVLLGHDIEHGLLVITTATKLQERLVTKVYDVRDLLDRGLHPSRLIAGLQTTTPGPWLAIQGEGGTLTLFADTLLVVRQTSHNHDEVTKFLTSLRSQLSDQPEVPRVIASQSKTPPAIQPGQPNPTVSKPTTAPPSKPIADNQLRFDGKSFDEWLAVLDTERSPTRLAEAFQALKLLGEDTQAATIAERTLKVLRVVDASASVKHPHLQGRNLQNEFDELFEGFPIATQQKAYADELQNGNARSRKFVFTSGIGHYDLDDLDSAIADVLARAVLQLTRDSDESIRGSALSWLAFHMSAVRASDVVIGARNRFREALADKDPGIALSAVTGLVDSEKDATAVVKTLSRLVALSKEEDLTRGLSKANPWLATFAVIAESLKAAAMLGNSGVETAPDIAAILLVEDREVFYYPQFNLPTTQDHVGVSLSLKDLAALALARMGKSAIAALPAIEEALHRRGPLELYSLNLDLRGIPRQFGGRDLSVTSAELLLAAKARIEEKPVLDLSKPEEITIAKEDVILSLAIAKLLHVEKLLLLQRHGPGFQGLDQELKVAEERFKKVRALYEVRAKEAGSQPPAKPAGDQLPKFQGKSLAQWIDDAVASNNIPHEPIQALLRDASPQDIEPLLNRSLQALNAERSTEGLNTNAQILGLIGRQHFADRVTQAFLDLLRQRFEEELRKQGPELKSDKQLERHYQGTFAALRNGLYVLSRDKVGSLLQRELKEGSLTGRRLAMEHVLWLDQSPLESQLQLLLPLLLPFATRQVPDLPPAWEKQFEKSVWELFGKIAMKCSLNADQQRLLIDLAETAIADPSDIPLPVRDLTVPSVFHVLVKLSPKSERLLPTILKLESQPRTGAAKASHSHLTCSLLAQIAKHDPKALQALIRLLDHNAFNEETNDGNLIGGDTVTISPRVHAIARLGSLGPPARDALPVLKKQLESKNKAVVAAAEKAIKQIEAAKDDKNAE